MERPRFDSVFGLHPLKVPEKRTKVIPLALVLHADVDYVHKQGLGIGIVQRAQYVDGVESRPASHIKTLEKKFGVKREYFERENVKTLARAWMLTLSHALGLALRTIKRDGVHASKVEIRIASMTAVETVNHHLQNAPESLEQITETNDRLSIKNIVATTRRASRRGIEVSIVITDKHDTTESRFRARALARLKGSKACKSRRAQERLRKDINRERGLGEAAEAS